MSNNHFGGNTLPEITREEHAGDINAKRSVIVETAPTDTTKLNPSYVLSYNANMYCVKIEETIGATTYTTNIVPQDGDTVIVSTKTISLWT